MPEMKRCKQCGILKATNAFRPYTYSKAKGTTGRFRICRQCESLNTTYRRLCADRDAFWDPADQQWHYTKNQSFYWQSLTREISKVEAIYRLLEAHGNVVPALIHPAAATQQPPIVTPSVDAYMTQLGQMYDVSGVNAASTDKTHAEQESFGAVALQESVTAKYASTEQLAEDTPSDLSRWFDMSFEDFREKGLTPDYLQEVVYEALKAKYRPQTGVDRNTYLPVYDDTYKVVLNRILKLFDDYEDWCMSQETEAESTVETAAESEEA